MEKNARTTRRDFVKTTALAGAAAAVARKSAASPKAQSGFRPGEMKLGSVSWNFRGIGQGPPWDEAVDAAGALGLQGIELIVSRPEDLDNYWKKEPALSTIQKKLEKNKLAVSQFVLFQSAVENLSNLDADKRNRSLDVFEEGCKIAAKLNAPYINIVAPWARELSGPREYLPRYFAVGKNDAQRKYHIDIADGFDWDAVWTTFVRTIKEAVERAQSHGVEFTLENHTHTLVHDATAFLKLWDEVKSPALGMNLDIGWIQLQREYPPFAIHKVKHHLRHVHIRDIDAQGLIFVGIGEGVMDYPGVVEALKKIGYTGFLSFEQDGVPDMNATIRNGKAILEKLIGS
ncbi:MAG: sugar phosphate isomerase/epimerase [Candidatus Omnitrophota bacterium]